MKRMKLIFPMLIAIALTACNSGAKQESVDGESQENKTVEVAEKNSSKVKVYYYHGARKCATCKAVGEIAESTVKNDFANNEEIGFCDINIEEDKNAELVKKYEMSGSGLLICVGEKKEDLTGFAFQNALNNPDKLQEKIIEVIKAHI